MPPTYRTPAKEIYNGPEFDEYCISEGRYLPATRDRSPCLVCPLEKLCQAGFEEQVRRVIVGEDPNLTSGCTLTAGQLTADVLFDGLDQNQIEFLKEKLPGLNSSN